MSDLTTLKTMHIESELGWSGGQMQSSALCSYLKSKGHKVIIVCRPDSKVEQWAGEQGIQTYTVEQKPLRSINAVLAMKSIILKEKPDIIHLHASRSHVLGSAAAYLAGKGIVVATRRMDHEIKKVWPNTSAYGKWTHALVAISGAVKEAMIASGVDPGKIHTIESGADFDKFANASADPSIRKNLGIADDIPIVTAAASLTKRKGHEYLISASRILKQANCNIHVVLAGEGDMRPALQAQAQQLGVEVSFLGLYKDMPRLIASSDIFVMPSMMEGLGVAVLEALAARKPVIASAVGGLKESVINGKTGLSVPPGDPDALSNAIMKLLGDNDLAQKLAAAGQEHARNKFSIKSMAERNEKLYYSLIRGEV